MDTIDDLPTYELLVQSVVDYAIYMLSPEGRVATWNAGAERIKGYSAAEIIGEHFSRFFFDDLFFGEVLVDDRHDLSL